MTPKQIRDAGLPCFPQVAHRDGSGKVRKLPRVPKGESWQLSARRPLDCPQLDWSSGLIGIPVPAGIVIIDLDLYEGVTRESVDEALGCRMPWEQSLIQTTMSGGEHHAYRTSNEIRNSNGVCGIKGFDTKSAGKGCFTTGPGYVQTALSVLALSTPERLPELPAEAARRMAPAKRPEADPGAPPLHVDRPPQEIIEAALGHIDPGCERSRWLDIGYTIKALYADDPSAGLDLFDRWSSGSMWFGDPPDNYQADGQGSCEHQWTSFNPRGDETLDTVFYYARMGGWRPPFDANMVFGDGARDAAFDALVDRIRERATDAKSIPALINEIRSSPCNDLQMMLLTEEVKSSLADSGIKSKELGKYIDGLLQGDDDRVDDHRPGSYGSNDTLNAETFLASHYPDGTLCQCDGRLYRYNGKSWQHITEAVVRWQVATVMARDRLSESKMASCYRLVKSLIDVRDGELGKAPRNLMVFDNGVLDTNTGQLGPHDNALFSVGSLPYDWRPDARCPDWLEFLYEVFDGDHERAALLQEWMGYLISNQTRYQKIMLMIGGPRGGKGTIGKVIRALVGQRNFAGGSLSSLTSDSYLDEVSEKTVIFMGDAERSVGRGIIHQVIERMKTISGNDEVSFHRMYHGAVSRALPARITIACNGIPALFDDSGALASRMLILPFDNSWLGREDHTLEGRLINEIEGIAAWAMKGLERLTRDGKFTVPESSKQEAQEMAESYSHAVWFVRQCCRLAPGARIKSRDLYDRYVQWCLSEGEDAMRRRTFTRALKDAYRGRGVRYCVYREGNVTQRGFDGIDLLDLTGVDYE